MTTDTPATLLHIALTTWLAVIFTNLLLVGEARGANWKCDPPATWPDAGYWWEIAAPPCGLEDDTRWYVIGMSPGCEIDMPVGLDTCVRLRAHSADWMWGPYSPSYVGVPREPSPPAPVPEPEGMLKVGLLALILGVRGGRE